MHDQIRTERYLALSGIHDFVQQVARYEIHFGCALAHF